MISSALARSLALSFVLVSVSGAVGQDLTWYKGNTHTHSLWSDGNDFPDMITDWYVKAGYDFLVLSDHNILSQGEKWMSAAKVEQRRLTLGRTTLEKYQKHFGPEWVETRGEGEALEVRLKTLEEVRERFEKPGEFLLIEGEEITDSFEKVQIHINALNLAELIKPQKGDSPRATMRNNLIAVREQEERTGRPILAHLNHPNFQWSLSAEDLAYVVEEQFFEVYNGHPSINHQGNETTPGDERIWDIANTIRLAHLNAEPLYGMATDDSHQYHGGDVSPGRGWVMVQSASLEGDALIRAMKAGAFYATTGVLLTEIVTGPASQEVVFQIEGRPGVVYETKIIGTRRGTPENIGEVLATFSGTAVRYPLKGDELYVRATITASTPHPNPSFKGQLQQAWTQPIGWERD